METEVATIQKQMAHIFNYTSHRHPEAIQSMTPHAPTNQITRSSQRHTALPSHPPSSTINDNNADMEIERGLDDWSVLMLLVLFPPLLTYTFRFYMCYVHELYICL